jgi:hypothetical protein
MNTTHAALLLMLGWYLMAPPSSIKYGAVIWDMNAPVTKWMVVKSFDTAEECEESKASFDEEANKIRPIYDVDSCVASDDPRLQEK